MQPNLFGPVHTAYGPDLRPALLSGATDPASSDAGAKAAETVKQTHFAAILAILRRHRRRPDDPLRGHTSAEIAALANDDEQKLLPTTESVARRLKELISRGLIERIKKDDGDDYTRICTAKPTKIEVTVVRACI